MKEKKDLTTASTVRINIDYKKKAPKIKFQSPNGSRISPNLYVFSYILQLAMVGAMVGSIICTLIGIETNLFISLITALVINLIVLRIFLWNTLKKNLPDLALGHTIAEYSKKWTKVPKEKYLEIPEFDNIKMDYRATKDFANYLN